MAKPGKDTEPGTRASQQETGPELPPRPQISHCAIVALILTDVPY